MTFSDLLKLPSVIVPLRADNSETAIAALVGALELPKGFDRAELKSAVLAREAAGSTGIGHGVAIPHARSPRVLAPLLAVGRAAVPLDFKSADAVPVTLVFLLAVPATDPKSHLKVLAALSRVSSDKKLLKGLNSAQTPEEFHALIAGLPI